LEVQLLLRRLQVGLSLLNLEVIREMELTTKVHDKSLRSQDTSLTPVAGWSLTRCAFSTSSMGCNLKEQFLSNNNNPNRRIRC
jgi:hypothetical protein